MIQTVTGAVKKADMGAVLMHEHISCASLSFRSAFGDKWLDRDKLKKLSCEALKQTKEQYGLGLFVDGTPIDLGRDPELLREISELTGIKIIASTGFYFLQGVEAFDNDAGELAGWLIEECKTGIRKTGIKPGILKCATGGMGITDDNRKRLSAMAMVQKSTGLPLYVHCEHFRDIALQQLETLLACGADAEKIIIGHAAMRPNGEYLESILARGCFVCMDQCHCYPDKFPLLVETLVTLCQKGYAEKLLISNDYCIHNDCWSREKNGLHLTAGQHADALGFVFGKLYQNYITAGGTQEDWETMLNKNPIQVLDH